MTKIGGTARRYSAWIVGRAIGMLARFVTAVQPLWQGMDPRQRRKRIYFANHASHGDFILIWSVLPPWLRDHTRPVAGADYWGGGGIRGFVGAEVFDALLIDRTRSDPGSDPVSQMSKALDAGSSLILFPEGTRNLTDQILLPFKSGLYHLAKAQPTVELVPVWIENLNRVLPKGSFVPVPLMCRTIFGAPLLLAENEEKDAFLDRTRNALLALRPSTETGK